MCENGCKQKGTKKAKQCEVKESRQLVTSLSFTMVYKFKNLAPYKDSCIQSLLSPKRKRAGR